MSHIDVNAPEEGPDEGPQDSFDEDPYADYAEPRRKGKGCILVLVVLLALGAGGYFAVDYGIGKIKAQFTGAPDYAGPGSGSLVFQVTAGATSTEIGNDLKKAGVVKSVSAFTEAARGDDRSRNIQVGYYELMKQMKATDALDVLVEPKNLIQNLVVVPEGARVRQIVATIDAKTDIPKADVTAALRRPMLIGLPADAKGNPEGYLYPATYTVVPGMTAVELLKQMVAKTVSAEKELDIESGAAKLGLTPEQILTVASIIEYEANKEPDYAKVARVLYNRLDINMALQLDSTVSYVSKREGDVWTTSAERQNDSAYNTYQHVGLPPGPIGSPGAATIKAALNPAKGNWLYFVPDFENGTTLFTNDYAEHVRNANKAKEYCRTHEEC